MLPSSLNPADIARFVPRFRHWFRYPLRASGFRQLREHRRLRGYYASKPLYGHVDARERGQWAEAEGHLHRALDNGAGPAAWEELGHGHSQAGDHLQAELCYANALRAARGQRTYPLRAEPPGNRRLSGAMIDAPQPPAGE